MLGELPVLFICSSFIEANCANVIQKWLLSMRNFIFNPLRYRAKCINFVRIDLSLLMFTPSAVNIKSAFCD